MNYKFALIGAGRIGQVHARAISQLPNANLICVADSSETAAHMVAEQFDAAQALVDDIAKNPDIDAVLICTPTESHADLVELFSNAGKAVFCEKPIDLNLDRVVACLQTISRNQTPFMVGFNQRFDPSFSALKERVAAGEIGSIESIHIVSRDPAPPPIEYLEKSGGIFKDMTIHDFDMCRHLLGSDEIETVSACGSVLFEHSLHQIGDFDTVNVILHTKSGKQCVISNSRRSSYGYDQRLEVHGALGMLRAQNQRPIHLELANNAGFQEPVLHDFFMTRYAPSYQAELGAFVDLVSGGTPAYRNAHDGLQALRIAAAADLAVAEGRTVSVAEVV